MNIMGKETPVEMPSMEIYNTDLMKAYIAGVKQQYDDARLDYKDFMKQYLDFYSILPGATERYHELTDKGAANLINLIYALGADPFKNQDARTAIAQYIASRPIGELKGIEAKTKQYEDYKANRDKLILSGKFDPEFEQAMLGGKTFGLLDVNDNIPTTPPMPSKTLDEYVGPYTGNFGLLAYLGPDKENPDYEVWGTKDELVNQAVESAYKDMIDDPYGKYLIKKYGGENNAKAVLREAAAQHRLIKNEMSQAAKDRHQILVYKQQRILDRMYPKPGRSSGGKSSGGSNGGSGVYPKYATITAGLTHLTPSSEETFMDAQTKKLNKARKGHYTAERVLKMFTVKGDAGSYASWHGVDEINGDGATIAFNGDMRNLLTENQLAAEIGYLTKAAGKTQHSLETINHVREKYKSNTEHTDPDGTENGIVTTKRYTGDTVIAQVGNHIFSWDKVRIAGRTLYEPTGYVLDPENGEALAESSQAAILRDARAAHDNYGLKQGLSVGEIKQ